MDSAAPVCEPKKMVTPGGIAADDREAREVASLGSHQSDSGHRLTSKYGTIA